MNETVGFKSLMNWKTHFIADGNDMVEHEGQMRGALCYVLGSN